MLYPPSQEAKNLYASEPACPAMRDLIGRTGRDSAYKTSVTKLQGLICEAPF